jgi:hypothetical protein
MADPNLNAPDWDEPREHPGFTARRPGGVQACFRLSDQVDYWDGVER